MKATLTLNGWLSETHIKVIGVCRPSKIGRDLLPQLCLQLVQATAGDLMVIQKPAEQQQDKTLHEWQLHFSKQFHILFNRIRRIRNYKVQADFFKAPMPAQEKSRRVPITLQS